MNEDSFNGSLRGFLKKVGITSQREIEKAVRDAVASGEFDVTHVITAGSPIGLTVGPLPAAVQGYFVPAAH